MPSAPLTPELRALAPALAGRVALILAALCALVAARFLRDPSLVPLTVPLWNRRSRAAHRFARAMDNLAAGRARKSHGSAHGGRPPAPLPAGHGWLIRAVPYEAASLRSQLQHVLSEPGAVELIQSSPAAGRILRPICRMLGLRLPFLARPRVRRPRQPAQAPEPATQAAPKIPPPHPPVLATPARRRPGFRPWSGRPAAKPA